MASSKKSRSSKRSSGNTKTIRRIKVRRNTTRPIVIVVKQSSSGGKKKRSRSQRVIRTAAIMGAGAGTLALLSPAIAGYAVTRSVKRYEKSKKSNRPPRRKRFMPYKSALLPAGPSPIVHRPTYRDIHGYRNR